MERIRYIREGKRPIGCIVAIDIDCVGWSLCHPRDTFSKKMARKIALSRAKTSPRGQAAFELIEKYLPEEGPPGNTRIMKYVYPALILAQSLEIEAEMKAYE